MKKPVIYFVCFVFLILFSSCSNGKEIPTDVKFDIDGKTATYTDEYYHVTVKIPDYHNYTYAFDFADPTEWISENSDSPPCRSLSLFYHDNEAVKTDATAPNLISINGWNSFTGYYKDFEGKEIEIKTEDGKKGQYKIRQSAGRVQLIFSRQDEFCQIEVDFDQDAYAKMETTILKILSSLRSL